MDLNLKNKVALVTGSSRGLGYAMAVQLLNEGATTIINSRSEKNLTLAQSQLLADTGLEPHSFVGDVGDPAFPGAISQFITSQFGRLDVLITNAGGPPPGSIETLSDDQWYTAVEQSFLGHMRLIRALIPLLRKSKSASILTVTSQSVKQPIENLLLSNSIRAATVGLTKTLALEFGKENIRVNSILPGSTKTERITNLFENRAAKNHTSIEIEQANQEKEIALGRIAEPVEFARVAVFLASPAASYLTGTMLSVDGGSVKGLF